MNRCTVVEEMFTLVLGLGDLFGVRVLTASHTSN